MAAQGQERTRRLAVSTMIFAAATGLSRVIGLMREIVAAGLLGARGAASAYTVANNVPNTVRSLVADAALGASFVPIFNDLLVRGERERAWRVASTVTTIAGLVLTVITVLGMLLAEPILSISGMEGEQLATAVELAQILFPIVVLLGLTGIVNAILYSFDEFAVPSLAPVAWNAVIIAFLLYATSLPTHHEQVVLYAVGTLVGTVVQLLILLPWLRGRGGRLTFAMGVRDPAVKEVFILMLPVTVGLGLINFNQYIATQFATAIGNGDYAPRAIEAAFRIYMLPQGMFSVAVAAVLFPTLSRLVSARDAPAFRMRVAGGIRQIGFLLIPSSVICFVLSAPIIRLLFQHGSWTADQTPGAAHALAAFAVGLTANGIILLLTRAFFAMRRPWVPSAIAAGNLTLNTLLNWAFLGFGVWGIPLATSIANLATWAALQIVLTRRVGPLEPRRNRRTFARIIVASAILGAISYGTWSLLDRALGRSVPAQFVSVGAAIGLGTLGYFWLAQRMRIEEARMIVGILRRRLAR
jgi:putative peptidoglycan lipid II flippase